MFISKTVGYAIRGLVYLSVQQEENKKVGVKEMAEKLDIPQHFLGKIMQELARRGVISSTKGPKGGFYTNSLTLETDVLKVVNILDGLEGFKTCELGLDKCSDANPCLLHKELKHMRVTLEKTLKNKKVIDMRDGYLRGNMSLVD